MIWLAVLATFGASFLLVWQVLNEWWEVWGPVGEINIMFDHDCLLDEGADDPDGAPAFWPPVQPPSAEWKR